MTYWLLNPPKNFETTQDVSDNFRTLWKLSGPEFFKTMGYSEFWCANHQVKKTIFGPLEMSQSMFVSDQQYDELDDAEFAVPYRQGQDGTSLYPVPRRAMKYIASQNPAGQALFSS